MMCHSIHNKVLCGAFKVPAMILDLGAGSDSLSENYESKRKEVEKEFREKRVK